MRKWKIIATCSLAFVLLFSIYISFLYRQMEEAFSKQAHFVPTRFYSDVTRISPPQPRSQVEARLKSLAYATEASGDGVRFTLHPVDFPQFLLPDDHPVLTAGGKTVLLDFSGSDLDAVLQSVTIEGPEGPQEVPDLYLEPELIATLSRADEKIIRAPLKWDEVPDLVWKAILAVEDQHFREHAGLDPRGFARAIFVNLKTLSFTQGGSTITMQLVKNLMARRTRNPFLKFNELFLSVLLEFRYSKDEILERYLNEVPLGQVGNLEIHGVAEGAEHFFGKDIRSLNLAEVAIMAGLIRGPGFYSPYRYRERAIDRQRLVLKKMVETGYIAQEEAEEAARFPIRFAPPKNVMNKMPYFTDFVKAELIRKLKDRTPENEIASAGYRVYTTLDPVVAAAAQRAVTQGVAALEKRLGVQIETDRLEGALAAVDQSNGFIRALVGGRSYSESTFNRILNMKRQVGSTFKPFVYLSAYLSPGDSNGVPYTPGYPMLDASWKLKFDKGRQSWAPRNYDPGHKGWIPLRSALANSVNTVAAKLGVQVGVTKIIETARALGIESDLPAVPALSLGVAELSPVELLRAYAAVANHGLQDSLTVIRAIMIDEVQRNGDSRAAEVKQTFVAHFSYSPRQVIDAGAADLLTDTMTSTFVEGTAREAIKFGFDRPAAGKTGTTSQYRDSWFAGYTPQLTAVVWVGMDQTKNNIPTKIKLTGGGSALPIWIDFMKEALAGDPAATFPLSPSLVQVRLDRRTGLKAADDCPDPQTILDRALASREPSGSSCEALDPPSAPETTIE